MAEEYKETLEWRALTRIWKAIEPAKREPLMEDFRLLTDWIKNDMVSAPPPEPQTGPQAGFLDGLSPPAKMLVLKRLTAGRGNLYDECMALAQLGLGEEAAWQRMAQAHQSDAALISAEPQLREIIAACVRRVRLGN